MARASFIQAVASLSLCLVPFTVARPDGAPVSACESMHPGHTGIQAQPGPAPYTIKANSSTFMNGQPVAVQIVGPDCQGVLLQARENGSTKPLGSWINPPPNTRILECGQNPSGAVTHANTTPKTKDTTYTWMPPDSNCPNSITFVATAAESFQTYFVDIKSDALTKDPAATCDSSRIVDISTSSDNTTSISTSSDNTTSISTSSDNTTSISTSSSNTTSISTSSSNTTSNGTSTTETPSISTTGKLTSASSETLSTWVFSLHLLLAGYLFLVLNNLY